jgi:hypothetical protein
VEFLKPVRSAASDGSPWEWLGHFGLRIDQFWQLGEVSRDLPRFVASLWD